MANTSKIEKNLKQFRDFTETPAVGVLRLTKEGIFDSGVSGTIHRDSHEPVRIDDAWHLGSCTKAITALLIGCLVERGKLDWDSSIAELFEDINSHPAWENITLQDLLQLRAGVPANPKRREMSKLWEDTSPPDAQRTDRASMVFAEAPSNPGEFLYSNLSYTLAGAVVDRVAGSTYEQALDEFIIEPLGITSAGFGAPPRIRGHGRRIQVGRFFKGPGSPRDPADFGGADNPVLLNPAGRLHLTLDDWAKVISVFLNDGNPLVQPETLHRLTTAVSPESMAMGWGDASSYGGWVAMQGSNTMWSATALLGADRDKAILVVANDGRDLVLDTQRELAAAGFDFEPDA